MADAEPDYMGLDQEALEPDHQLVPAAVRATEPGNGEDQGPSPPVQSPAEAPEGSPPKTDLRLQAVPEVDEERCPEWEAMPDIPQHWRPLPLFLVRDIPLKDGVDEAEIREVLEAVARLEVHSVSFDDRSYERVLGKRTALVRLAPLPLPWKQAAPEQDVKLEAVVPDEDDEASKRRRADSKPLHDGDVLRAASRAVQLLKAAEPPIRIGGEAVAFELSSLQVQLYIGNLSAEWQEDTAFVEAMSKYGSLERAFVVRNAAGLSKGYGFVEFSLPGSALACKQAMDEIERSMRPDPRRPRDKVPTSRGEEEDHRTEDKAVVAVADKEDLPAHLQAFRAVGWPEASSRLVKLLRAEWASMRNVNVLFSKVLYVTNLRTNNSSQQQLRGLFEHFGRIAEVTVPINKATNSTKGFAFVAFANGLAADRAYRALEQSGSDEIGGALVSFANSAKATEMQSRPSGTSRHGGYSNRSQTGQGSFSRGGPGPNALAIRGAAAGRPAGGRANGRPGSHDGGDLMRQQRLHMQAGMAAHVQMARQMEMRMQHQMQAQQVQMQAQMQAQLRQAQMQVQQIQQQAQQLQRQTAQAQAKAAAEAEARKRVEDQARRAAATAPPRMDGVMKRGHFAAGYSTPPETGISAGYGPSGSYGHQTGGSSGALANKFGGGAAAAYHSAGHYGGVAGKSSQGYGGPAGSGYGEAYSGQGFDSHEYDGAAGLAYGGGDYTSGEGGYGMHPGFESHDGYGGSGYGSGYANYGAGEGRAGPDGVAAGYHSNDYGPSSYGQGPPEAGYGISEGGYEQAGYGGYGQQGAAHSTKRNNPYSQASYPSYGGGSTYGQGADKMSGQMTPAYSLFAQPKPSTQTVWAAQGPTLFRGSTAVRQHHLRFCHYPS